MGHCVDEINRFSVDDNVQQIQCVTAWCVGDANVSVLSRRQRGCGVTGGTIGTGQDSVVAIDDGLHMRCRVGFGSIDWQAI